MPQSVIDGAKVVTDNRVEPGQTVEILGKGVQMVVKVDYPIKSYEGLISFCVHQVPNLSDHSVVGWKRSYWQLEVSDKGMTLSPIRQQ